MILHWIPGGDVLPPFSVPSAGTAITIGNFDGLHLGHQALLALTRRRAEEAGRLALAVTFEPHPLEVLSPTPPPRLTSASTRLALLEAAGMGLVVLARFSREVAGMSPENFIALLLKNFVLRDLVLGHDFSLGRDRAGTPERLALIGAERGFTVDRLPPQEVEGQVVSSTKIRQLLAAGKAREAALLLGRPHSLRGRVVSGQRRGRHLGFPTANLEPGEVMLPAPGVYASWAAFPGEEPVPLLSKRGELPPGSFWPAVTNIGHNPTFGPAGLSVETHLLGFSGDVYGRELEIALVDRLRPERTFSGPAALKEQISRDVAAARQLLKKPLAG